MKIFFEIALEAIKFGFAIGLLLLFVGIIVFGAEKLKPKPKSNK